MPVTEAGAQPNAAQRALERRLGPQAVVDVDAATGTPRVLARLDGTLTGAASGAPEDVAMSYVRRNLDVLGLTEADLDDAASRPRRRRADGVTEVRWRQAVDGIPAADSELRVNVTDDGRVLNVLGSPAPDLDPDTTPSLTPGEAVRAVQEDVGVYRALPRDSGPAGATRATEYADGSEAELTLFKGGLAWRVLYYASSTEVYDAFVDAKTGRVLQAHNMVKEAAPALGVGALSGCAAGRDAAAGRPRDARVPDRRRERPVRCRSSAPGPTSTTTTTTRMWQSTRARRSLAPAARSTFTFAARTTGTGCSASFPCSWDSTVANSWQANRNQNGVQAFYLANRFRDHLAASPINFTGFSGASTGSTCTPTTARAPGPTTITATTRTC